MPLTALRASDCSEVEGFSIEPPTWNAMRKMPLGTYVMVGTKWPAILKRSIRGLQFFAYAPGYTGTKPEPESECHLRTKTTIVKALRSAGFTAWVERPGVSKAHEPWQADVLCETKRGLIAFEVQLAQQTLEIYEERTARYNRSDVKCVWLVRSPKHYFALTKAIRYRYDNRGITTTGRASLSHLAVLPFEPGDEKAVVVEDMRVAVFPNGDCQRIDLFEFSVGVAMGRLIFSNQEWQWRDVESINGRRHG